MASLRFRDLFFNQTAAHVRAMAFRAISRTQHEPQAVMAAFALCLIVMCRKYKIRVPEVMAMAGRIYNQAQIDDPTGHHGAIVKYIEHELPDL